MYLQEKYGNGTDIQPKDPQKQTRILQFLNFDCGMLFRRMSDCLVITYSLFDGFFLSTIPIFFRDQYFTKATPTLILKHWIELKAVMLS